MWGLILSEVEDFIMKNLNFRAKRGGDVQLLIAYVCVLMPTHCTITCFGFHARQIDGIECGLFSNHALLGQTTLRVRRVSVYCCRKLRLG